MVEKDLIIKEKLDHSGLFNFSELYSYMHSWFKNNLYGVNEEKYSEKVSGASRDISFEWKATKKISDYFRIEDMIKVDVVGLTEVEVEIDGKKKRMNKGKIAMEIKGILLKDPKNTWDETVPVYKFLREAYDKYIIPQRINSVVERVEVEARAFKDEVKAYLELTGKR
ncbi:MAG TPA: hypothetical protein VI544_01040 [Candidatus Nanoarchaeia archaeon]|nr:hypothetical protein [Candidatus Nanoarchaeia archaeon]